MIKLMIGSVRVGVWGAALLMAVLMASPPSARAASLTLKIRAFNPSQTEKQSVEVKAFLPKRVRPEDVISAGDLSVSYDVASKSYFVHQTVEMAPAETRTYEVTVNDIWTIPPDTIKEMSDHAKALTASLKGTDKGETAAKLGKLIEENLRSVADRQAANAVGAVKPADHIRAFDANMEVVERIRRDLGVLENLAVAADRDPQRIMGAPSGSAAPEPEPVAATGEVVTIHIKVVNPSLVATRTNFVARDFPAEIRPTDVIDAGGLQIGFDAARNICYAYAESLSLAPQESKTFDVRIRNPWSDALLRVPKLEARVGTLIGLIKDEPKYKTVVEQARDLARQMQKIKEQKAPDTLDEQYIAFARNREDALRGIETRIRRLEELFQPREPPVPFSGPVMDIPRPDRRTTWAIIYIILGFLAFFSVLFFFRWYGRTKDEVLRRGTGQESTTGNEPSGPGGSEGSGRK